MYGLSIYDTIHAYDGYSPKDIGQMAKDKPEVRSAYNKSINMKRKYERLAGHSKPQKQKLQQTTKTRTKPNHNN